ncbi:uncharacterized protein TrAFT101_008397 [Trichoderma asperellum]|uniref:uncharacterized protein n=1 Tax=Trichoderma asperellum TaxID=101201 RepID=UPI003330CDD4|nr:hypothetical protein TrAFT101_008397 [Trichoderma asperellum]
MKIFHQFFLKPRILAILSPEHKFADGDPVQNLGQGQEDALKNIVNFYNNRVPASALWASDNAKYKVLARFLTDMRREDIVAEAEKDVNFPWHIEWVHAILGWRNRGVDECVADLKKAIDEASRHKTSIYKSLHEIIIEEDISFY